MSMEVGGPKGRSAIDFDELERSVAGLPRKQQQIGDALLESPEVFAFGTLASLEKAGPEGQAIVDSYKKM